MVAQPRTHQTKARHNRHNIVKRRAYMMLVSLVLIGGAIGFFLGKNITPVKTITQTVEVPVYETVEVPVYETVEVSTDESGLPMDTSDVFLYDVPLSDALQKYIYEICADNGVPVTLVLAMIEYESGFNPDAVSSTDDYGLMQINAINHERLEEQYRCADMMNPYQNVFCGVSIIGVYLEEYDGDYTHALMAYNMGEYGAQEAWSNGVTSTSYVADILSIMAEYEEVKDNVASVDNE